MGCGPVDSRQWIPFGEILPEGLDSNPSDFYPDEPWPYLANGSPNLLYVWKVSKQEMKAIDL